MLTMGNKLMTKNRNSSLLFICLATLLLCLISRNAQATDQRPNILLIVSDDHSPMLGTYGDEYATTPNLDAMASQGIQYNHAWSNAPVCSPARATLITGMYATSVGLQNMRTLFAMPDYVKWLPEYMQKAGYYTVNVGKHDYNTLEPKDAWSERVMSRTLKNWDRSNYFKQTDGKKPFFAIVNLLHSHESKVMYDMEGKPRSVADIKHNIDEAPLAKYFPEDSTIRRIIAQYYDNVSEVDEAVGIIFKSLERDNLKDNTIVIFMADHGTGVARSKRWPYNSGLQIPLIAHFPEKLQHLASAPRGSKVNEIVSFVDIAPTVLNLAGLEVPKHFQGRAFLGKSPAQAPQYAFGFRDRMDERLDLVRTAMDGRYHYMRNFLPKLPYAQHIDSQYAFQPLMPIWHKAFNDNKLDKVQSKWFGEKPAEELYDLQNDPHETNNLAAVPKHQKVLKRMREATMQWMIDTRDTGVLTEAGMTGLAGENVLFTLLRENDAPDYGAFLKAADQASRSTDLNEHLTNIQNPSPIIRFWGVTGLQTMGGNSAQAVKLLEQALKDKSAAVRVVAAEALCNISSCTHALEELMHITESQKGAARLTAINAIDRLDMKAKPVESRLRTLAKKLSPIKSRSSVSSEAKKGDEVAIQANMHLEYAKRVLKRTLQDLAGGKPWQRNKAPLEGDQR